MIKRFFNGFDFILRGRRHLSAMPELKKWAVMPLVIDVLVLGLAIYFGLGAVKDLVYQLSVFALGSATSGYFDFLYYPLLVLFWLIAFIMCFYFVYVLASVVASPFNSVLAEKILISKGVIKSEPSHLMSMIKVSVQMLVVSLKRAAFLLVVGLVLFVLSFIPGLNLLAAFSVFVLLAFDSMDYAFEASKMSLNARIEFFKKNFVEFCGMGAFVGLTAFIPGLTLLLMPLAVVGAAELFSELTSKSK